jgi:hypothetical protein
MFGTEPGENRRQFGFDEAVIKSFEFLRSFQLKPAKRSATLVRYESKTVFVNVYHGRASYEIGIEVGRKSSSVKYGLDYMVALAGPSALEAEGFGRSTMFQVCSREGVQQIVPKVAELLRKYGDSFLRGDIRFYEQLDEANRRASAEYAKRQLLEGVRKNADAAWSAKHFGRVAELYGTMRDELTIIEAKRLAYAEKQTRPSSR